MQSRKDRLTELFIRVAVLNTTSTPPQNVEWESGSIYDFYRDINHESTTARFQLGDSSYKVYFTKSPLYLHYDRNPPYHLGAVGYDKNAVLLKILFDDEDNDTEDTVFTPTNKGEHFQSLPVILSIIRSHVQKENPEVISFSGSTPKLQRLYERLLAREGGGYVKVSHDLWVRKDKHEIV